MICPLTDEACLVSSVTLIEFVFIQIPVLEPWFDMEADWYEREKNVLGERQYFQASVISGSSAPLLQGNISWQHALSGSLSNSPSERRALNKARVDNAMEPVTVLLQNPDKGIANQLHEYPYSCRMTQIGMRENPERCLQLFNCRR